MTFLGNLIWFILGGWIVGGLYLIGSLIFLVFFFPVFFLLLPLVGYAFWPFGKRPVPLRAIERYKKHHPEKFENSKTVTRVVGNTLRRIAGLVWAIFPGWIIAIVCLLAGVANFFACVFIITIPVCLPNAMAFFKLARVSLVPFTVRIVHKQLADEIEVGAQRSKL